MFSYGYVLILSSLIFITIGLPACHDTIPFPTKLAQSPLIVYGDIIETSVPLSSDRIIQKFNITFLVKCTLKGNSPMNENIIIEHSLPGKISYHIQIDHFSKFYLDNPTCYRTLVNGYTYVFFLHPTISENYYQQMSFHELLFNDDTTVEILRRTCGIQTQPFHDQVDEQCPIVSVGCE